MIRVDFHILASDDAEARLRHACKVAEKAYRAGYRIVVQTDAQTAKIFDDLLWSHSDSSFVPHAQEPESPQDWPVVIYAGQSRDGERDYLINLADEFPHLDMQYKVIAEIIDEQSAAAGRDRYRRYRDAGASLNVHNINS